MANDKTTPTAEGEQTTLTPETTKAKKAPKPVTATYTIEDIASRARAHHKVPPEVVKAALKLGGKDKYTADEAKKLINEFLTKEVK